MIYTILLLLNLQVAVAEPLSCNVDFDKISDDKIHLYQHCFKDAEVITTETPKVKSKLKYTPVCDRSKPVKLKLEEIFKNSCEQITKDMLFAYDGEFRMAEEEYHKPKLGDFSGMNNLKYLYLYRNHIEILHTGLFDDLGSLQSLNLANNQIEELPINIFDKLLKLRSLTLSFNSIKFLLHPIVSSNESSLYSLYLDANPLTHIYNPAFKNLSKLRTLDLSYSNLSIIGGSVFTPLDNLQRLDLASIATINILISEQTNEPTISFDNLSMAQFTQQLPFPINSVEIYDSESLMRNQNFIDQLEEKGVNVVN